VNHSPGIPRRARGLVPQFAPKRFFIFIRIPPLHRILYVYILTFASIPRVRCKLNATIALIIKDDQARREETGQRKVVPKAPLMTLFAMLSFFRRESSIIEMHSREGNVSREIFFIQMHSFFFRNWKFKMWHRPLFYSFTDSTSIIILFRSFFIMYITNITI